MHWRPLLLLAALLGAPLARADEGTLQKAAMPPEGRWQVAQVLINEERTDRLLYRPNDPRLMGRSLHIDRRALRSQLPEATPCAEPRLVLERMTLNTLLKQTLLPAVEGEGGARVFGLDIPGTRQVEVGWLVCEAGWFGPSLLGTPRGKTVPQHARTWFVFLADGRALMRWYGDTVLLLRQVH